MPHRPSVGDPDDDGSFRKSQSQSPNSKNMWGRTWNKVENWLKKDAEEKHPVFGFSGKSQDIMAPDALGDVEEFTPKKRSILSLPRELTFQRQISERRDRLAPHEPHPEERRALSADRSSIARGHGRSPSSSPLQPSQSAPDIHSYRDEEEEETNDAFPSFLDEKNDPALEPSNLKHYASHSTESLTEEQEQRRIQEELESKWILNLSMYFKDRSDREKFFLTYAEQPNKWRRVTVSCDYRNASPDSLEADLKRIHYQREKSARIYEAVRDSLLSIQFYPTVTNLKLKTIDGRLHIHCSEDLNEVIKYPHASLLEFVSCPRYKESDVVFQSHMSGFVYKVSVNNKIYVKKEIPGPEAVEEFLYEVNALTSLRGAKNVIAFEGLILNDDETQVKGLLISLATQGALVDIVYDYRYAGGLPWSLKERWARQIINGLMEIHEAGFVQGDFTLSNLVVDAVDNVSLIDINRRGCPVGWEPPELEELIRAGQRISMFIGTKTDLYQLGMVLWGLAMQNDEPERETRPLGRMTDPEVPAYYHHIVEACLSVNPRERLSAKELLSMFPPELELSHHDDDDKEAEPAVLRGEEQKYIDPDSAIGLEDLPSLRKGIASLKAPSQVSEASSYMTFADGTASTDYMFEGGDSVTQSIEVHPAAIYDFDEPALPINISQGDVDHLPRSKKVEAVDYFAASTDTHLQSPASDLSSSTPTIFAPAYVPLPPSTVEEYDDDMPMTDYQPKDLVKDHSRTIAGPECIPLPPIPANEEHQPIETVSTRPENIIDEPDPVLQTTERAKPSAPMLEPESIPLPVSTVDEQYELLEPAPHALSDPIQSPPAPQSTSLVDKPSLPLEDPFVVPQLLLAPVHDDTNPSPNLTHIYNFL